MQKIFKTRFTTDEAILTDIRKGGRFVQFQYVNMLPLGGAIGMGFMPTNIYYVPSDKKVLRYGWPYLLLSLLLGLGIGLIGYRQRNVTGAVLNEHKSAINYRGLNRTIKDTLYHINESINNSPLAY
ncbi:MAG: hypothetical protein J6K28_05365 [Alistipes sp.]|nr:hypothetical protein [Alistipes sp.]